MHNEQRRHNNALMDVPIFRGTLDPLLVVRSVTGLRTRQAYLTWLTDETQRLVVRRCPSRTVGSAPIHRLTSLRGSFLIKQELPSLPGNLTETSKSSYCKRAFDADIIELCVR